MSQSNLFLFAGRGKALLRVAASTGNVPTVPNTTTIPNNGFSELVAGHEGLEMAFNFVFGAAATGDMLIETVADGVATAAGTTFDTLTVTAALSGNWNAGEFLPGFWRIKNTSGQSVIVYYNNRLA